MAAPPLVTIGMSVFNAADTVATSVRSICGQTFTDWELLVIDDGSTDGIADVMRQFSDPRVRFIQIPGGNRGLATRLNQCISLARGRYFARMDADDVAYPERLERQVRFLDEHPEVDLLGTRALLFKGEGKPFGLYAKAFDHTEICRRPWWGFPLAHPTWMGKHEWFVRHQYRERHTRCEDQELLLRTFDTSQFAALSDVLLGYRMDRILAGKLGLGRLNYCRELVRQIHSGPSALRAARGILVHSLAYGRDIALHISGTVSRRSRQMFYPLDARVIAKWQQVWADSSSVAPAASPTRSASEAADRPSSTGNR